MIPKTLSKYNIPPKKCQRTNNLKNVKSAPEKNSAKKRTRESNNKKMKSDPQKAAVISSRYNSFGKVDNT